MSAIRACLVAAGLIVLLVGALLYATDARNNRLILITTDVAAPSQMGDTIQNQVDRGSPLVVESPPQPPPTAAAVPTQPSLPTRDTYPPIAGDILQQLIPRQFPDAECREMYSEHSIEKFRATRQPVCLDKADAGIIYHQKPWHRGNGNNDPHPSTVELRDLVKQADGRWTIPCAEINKKELHDVSSIGGAWYDSGISHTLSRLNLRSQQSGDMGCTNPIEVPALFLMREKGGGNNMYHELAQLFAAYLAKHIHGISDNTPDAHNMRFINFDKSTRNQNTHFDQFFVKAFSKKGTEPYEDLPVGTCFKKAILVHAGVRSIFWIGFGHKPTCFRFTMIEAFTRFILNGTLGTAGVLPPKERRMCYILRGSAARALQGEAEFIAKLRRDNPSVPIVDAVLGEGPLTTFESQLRWIQDCAVLAGTHGAGLTHALFLPEEAIVVEHHTPGHGTFRGLTKALGHTFIHVETPNELVGNYPAFARALRSAWQATNNFYHFHGTNEFVVPNDV